jgi:2-methylcitrate dehydratase PrpD
MSMAPDPSFTGARGQRLAAFASGTDWHALPAEVKSRLLDHVTDIVGVMFAGATVDECVRARRAAAAWGSGNAATVAGTRDRYPTATAAFLNALQARIHTYDDTYEPGNVHPGSSVVSTALALGESTGGDGPRFLSAVLAGYEVVTRVAASVSPSHYDSGFHNTGTCTVFGTAAAAARLLGFDAKATAHALGLAGATAGGLRQHQIDGGMIDSAFHGARAAQSGVMTALLQQEGICGPPGILDGIMGFCRVMSKNPDTSKLDADLGTRYEFLQMTVKPYPTCRLVHGPVSVALELRKTHAIDPARIATVVIETFRHSMSVSDRPVIHTPYDAIVSHQHGMAVALTHGTITLDLLTGRGREHAEVAALMERVKVVHAPDLEARYPASWPHRITITLRDGTTYSAVSEYPPGRTTPIPSADVDRKFLDNAAPVIGHAKAGQLLEALRTMDRCTDVRNITAMLTP